MTPHSKDRYHVLDGGGKLIGEFPYTFDGFVLAVECWQRNEWTASRLLKGGIIVNPNRIDLIRDDDDPDPGTSNGLTELEDQYWEETRDACDADGFDRLH